MIYYSLTPALHLFFTIISLISLLFRYKNLINLNLFLTIIDLAFLLFPYNLNLCLTIMILASLLFHYNLLKFIDLALLLLYYWNLINLNLFPSIIYLTILLLHNLHLIK